MQPQNFENAVLDRWGDECIVCTRRPEEWNGTQEKLSFHHVNGDDTDDRVENLIPVCQSCHIHIHRVDEPPYRKWHRQLPIEHRNAWNQYHHEYYEGPRLTREEAERRFGDDGGIPRSLTHLKREREDFDPSIFEPTSDVDSAGDTDDDSPQNDSQETKLPKGTPKSAEAVCDDDTTESDTTEASGSPEKPDEIESVDKSGPKFQSCPDCGRVGLPERIAEHDC